MIDLSEMTLQQLKELRRDINNALQGYDSNRKRQALHEIKAVCKKYGYELRDLVGERVLPVDKVKG